MDKQRFTHPLPLKCVRISDGFWGAYQQLVMDKVIPYQWEALNDRIPGADKSGCIRNFEIAAGRAQGEHYGFVFQDSDLAKWLEAVAYALTLSWNGRRMRPSRWSAPPSSRTVTWTPITSSTGWTSVSPTCGTITSCTASGI